MIEYCRVKGHLNVLLISHEQDPLFRIAIERRNLIKDQCGKFQKKVKEVLCRQSWGYLMGTENTN